LAAVATSCPTALAATATRCAPSLHFAPTAFASRFTASPKDLACVEIADSRGRSPAASAAMTGVNSSVEATARPEAAMRNLRVMSIIVVPVVVMSTAMVVTVVPVVVVVVAAVIAVMIALVIFPSLTLLIALAFVFCIVALIFGFVFRRSYEVHGAIAGVVFMAVPAPISCVVRRNVQVHRRRRRCLRFYQHRLGIDDLRRTVVSELHLAVHARNHLARQHDADAQVARVSAADAGEHDRNECDYTHMKISFQKKLARAAARSNQVLQLAWMALSAAAEVCTIN